MIHIRPYAADDHAFVLSLAPRMTIGMPDWREPKLCLDAVVGWIETSIERHGKSAMIYIACDEQGKRLGFASVSHETHFTGEQQAYMGELATSEATEGQGVGKALVQACEGWARDQGYRILALTTGAANRRGLGFYRHLGYLDEDVRLIRLLDETKGTPQEGGDS